MKQVCFAAMILSCFLFLTACGVARPTAPPAETTPSPTADSAYHKITAVEAKKMIDEGGVTVVDVRRTDEYAEKHLPGAIHIPNESIDSTQPEALPELDATLIIYCRTGVRSKQASDKLVDMGFENIYDMGGIVDWPYDVESGES